MVIALTLLNKKCLNFLQLRHFSWRPSVEIDSLVETAISKDQRGRKGLFEITTVPIKTFYIGGTEIIYCIWNFYPAVRT